MQTEFVDEKILVKRLREDDIEETSNINLIETDRTLNHKYFRNSFYLIKTIPNYREMIYRYILIISNKVNKKWLYLHFLLKKNHTNIIFQLPREQHFFSEPVNNYIVSHTCTFCNDKNDSCKECGGLEINPLYDQYCLTDDSCKCSDMCENDYCPFHRIMYLTDMKRRVVRCAPYSQPFTPEIESKKRYEFVNPNAYRILLESDLFYCINKSFKSDGIFTLSRQERNIVIGDLYISIHDITKLFSLTKQFNGQ